MPQKKRTVMDRAYLADTQVELIYEIITEWYGKGYPRYSPELRRAIEQTAEQGLFNEADIHYSLKAHVEAMDKRSLKRWVENGLSRHKESEASPSVLCLHAGNFPLAGFQNALGALLSGAEYWGKLSSRDPYLLDSFLRVASKYNLPNLAAWSTNLVRLKPENPYAAVLFAGDPTSLPSLRSELERQQKTNASTSFLIRTTHYSVAYLYKVNSEILNQLTEAMLRYEGLGCRSVAAVVTPHGLEDCRPELEQKMRNYIKEIPPVHLPHGNGKYQMAYNRAREVKQLYVPPFLVQEAEEPVVREGEICWFRGGVGRLREFVFERRQEIQTVYSDRPEVLQQELNMEQPVEPLSRAQAPAVDWKPDGVDTIEWIWNNLVH